MSGRPRCWCIDDFETVRSLRPISTTSWSAADSSRIRGNSPELAAGLRYHCSIPLYFQDKRLVNHERGLVRWPQAHPAELRLLSTIAYQVGISIERARLAEDATAWQRAEERNPSGTRDPRHAGPG